MGYYLCQLKALIKRNIQMKKASKTQTITEILFPIFMILMTFMQNKITETKKYEAKEPLEPIDSFGLALQGLEAIKEPTIGFILPENNQDKSIISKVMENKIFPPSIKYMEFKNQNEMNEFNDDYHNNLLAGIIFESDDYLHYTIRVNGTSTPDPKAEAITNYALGRYKTEKALLPYIATEADQYINIFSPIQSAVDQAIIRTRTNDNTIVIKPELGKFGKPASEYNTGGGGGTLASYIAIVFLMPTIIIVISIVQEKEKGIRDGLLMAGTHPTVFWLSWLSVYIAVVFVISLFVAVFFYITKTFSNCNVIILFLVVFLYGVSCCSLGFVFSTFFKKTKTAGTVVSLFMVLLSYANFASEMIGISIKKILSIIISPISIGSFVFEVNDLEDHFINLTFSNLFSTTAGFFVLALIINNVIYFVGAIILDNVLSTESARYLFTPKRKINDLHGEGEVTYEKDIQEDFNAKNGEICVVEVNRVHKIFQRKNNDDNDTDNHNNKNKKVKKSGEFLAVDDVSFKVYQNEIFAILGHNGAGKTTLINIMVGLLKATQGDVLFDGRSIAKDTNDIRKNFGVCAQSNIIYDELTVGQHIEFYAGLKGIQVDTDEILKDLDLLSQKQIKASKLSGGQKRKLCIGMAIIGDPKYIFLDEPTTGLDPLSRRRIWELLSKKKEGRVIFLTTHYMDEADILADRKVILNKGKIRCLGTSLYLKNHFNMNYDLDVETDNQPLANELIQNYLPEATYVYDTGNQNNTEENINVHTWRLPLNTTDKFSALLDELERQIDNKNGIIKKFGLSMPTLEELFIRLEDNTVDDDNIDNAISEEQCLIQTDDDKLPQLRPVEKISRFVLLKNLVKYRLKIFLKDKGFAFYNIIFPAISSAVVFILIGKIFTGEKVKSDSNVISLPEIYGNSFINLDPQSNLGITPENIISTVGNSSLVTNIPLKDIPYPEFSDTYYVSSIDGVANSKFYDIKIYYNDTMTHAIPATLNAVSNSILASLNSNDKIVVTSHPYDKNNDMLAILGLSIAGFMIGYNLVGGMSKFGPLVVRERVNQLLQQLQLNGVSRINYWISCFLSDNLIFLFSCLLIFIVGVAVQFQPLMDVKILIIILILLVIWSIPTMLYQYILNFMFNKEDTAYSMMSIINSYPVIFGYLIFTFINLSDADNIMESIANGKGLLNMKGVIFNTVITAIFPAYGIIAMIHPLFTMKMYQKLINYDINMKNLIKPGNGISPVLIVLIILIFVHFYLLIKFDAKKNQTNASDIHDLPENIRAKYEDILAHGDDDVYEEFEYVKKHQHELPISVYHLSKEYKAKFPTDKEKKQEIKEKEIGEFQYGDIHKSIHDYEKAVKTAVIDVNFGVRNHECFGLLGPNGAGKSTTLNTITSTIPQTTGKICFNGVETHVARLGEISMGYCPQNDILWKELTLREHLEFFLNIRGYSGDEAKEYATQYINCVGLEEHQNKRVGKLSGGTKRKLSLLIAICGYPKQILLDEPSAGMDPSTRRLIWNVIKKTKNMNDSALIMTTHSMEEAENLCDRLAILVNGRLTCIGSPEHLKMKFGEGYILELQSKDTERFHQEIVENAKLFDGNEYTMEKSASNRRKYIVKMTRNLGRVFEIMEQSKANGLVSDYSFNQTSLEQIFINFAKEQIINNGNEA